MCVSSSWAKPWVSERLVIQITNYVTPFDVGKVYPNYIMNQSFPYLPMSSFNRKSQINHQEQLCNHYNDGQKNSSHEGGWENKNRHLERPCELEKHGRTDIVLNNIPLCLNTCSAWPWVSDKLIIPITNSLTSTNGKKKLAKIT